ncbi:DNA-binding protein [Pseudoprevotella muciniphila]|uniref:DNA-binding protein n=1 Tax=Pseudoprevotella muciniphila TaxID=2133944 RepID=A0A5P8E6B8_9BACT|nr:HIRAN domain-containing protein [Pseudoprevotella muciniphila]QFQ12482.1 DNA-binding protein [Pseudoprevotella muciniphila]
MEGQIIPISESLLALLGGSSGGVTPFTREIFLLDIVVAGTTYCTNMEELAPLITTGTVLRMLRDPKNEHDEMAIGIYLDKERIGWVPMELNLIISRLMDAGKAFVCRVTETKWINKWFRIKAKISMIE